MLIADRLCFKYLVANRVLHRRSFQRYTSSEPCPRTKCDLSLQPFLLLSVRIFNKPSSPGLTLICFFFLSSKLIFPSRHDTELPQDSRADSNVKAFWKKSYWRRLQLGSCEKPSAAANKTKRDEFFYVSVIYAFKVRVHTLTPCLALSNVHFSFRLFTISTLSYQTNSPMVCQCSESDHQRSMTKVIYFITVSFFFFLSDSGQKLPACTKENFAYTTE